MCTIENCQDLCKSTLEASSVVMVPAKKSCGRGERGTTSAGEHRKKVDVSHTPGAGGRGSVHSLHGVPCSPAALRCLRPARQDAGQGIQVRRPPITVHGSSFFQVGEHQYPFGLTSPAMVIGPDDAVIPLMPAPLAGRVPPAFPEPLRSRRSGRVCLLCADQHGRQLSAGRGSPAGGP
jgi:hypothetical protein